MQKTKIPWCDYTINPVKGLCPMACPYCYARRMYKRFKWNPEIRFDFGAMDLFGAKPASKFFVGSTIELFGDWVKPEWMEKILRVCADWSGHTFIFLTKQPRNLIKFSPFPGNCWVGMSSDTKRRMIDGYTHLANIQASVKFVSFEPLMERMDVTGLSSINWVIIGSRTQPTQHPPREWVDAIITAADTAKIPVFIKEPMASHYDIQRQEFPSIGVEG